MKRTIILAMGFMFITTGLYAAVSDHVLKIELATTYEYGAPGDVLYYVFDAGIQIDETIVSATMQAPNGAVHPLVLDEEDNERWLTFSKDSPDLAGLDDFLYGTFTFTVEYSDTSSESTSIDYAMGNGDPISPVTQQPQFSYPTHNATDVPLALTYQFDAASDPKWDVTLEWEPEPDGSPGRAGELENLPYDTTSYGPVILSPDTLYSVGMAINNAIELVNADGIPVVMDMDAETHILFTTANGVLFPDYFPLDTATHGRKTFQWTYGRSGTYPSYIEGSLSVPYTSGDIEGTGVTNISYFSRLYATNDGSEVKWIAAFAISDDEGRGYISTDCNLTDHPAAWTFSTVTDDMLVDQGTYYFVDPNLTTCVMENGWSLLFDIQDVNVPFGQYDDAVIIWYIDEDNTFTTLDFSGKDIDLGITLPNGTQTGGYSVTDFDIYAYGVGMIAYGDVESDDGILNELSVLVNHTTVSDHISSIEIAQGWDYEHPDDNLIYEITFRVNTDTAINLIEFLTPAGHTFQIPAIAEQCNGDICTSYTSDGNTSQWEYYAGFSDQASLADYGDGIYTVTAHYTNGGVVQTTASFTVPGTSDPIPQPTQQPVLIYPSHEDTVKPPITFTWDDCDDAAVNMIIFALENSETTANSLNILPPDANSLSNVDLSGGSWEGDLSFGVRYDWIPNNDGVNVRVSKYSESDYSFIVDQDLFPLRTATQYQYQLSDNLANTWTELIIVDRQEIIDTIDYFHISAASYNDELHGISHLRSTSTGLYEYNPSGDEFVHYKAGPVGTKWNFYYEHNSGYNYLVIEIVSIEPVTVPYGNFDTAYKHRTYRCVDPDNLEQGTTPDWYEWIVPGIGFVKMVDYWIEEPGEAPRITELTYIYHPDFNNDGNINLQDFSTIGMSWSEGEGDADYNQECDLSYVKDKVIDFSDLTVFIDYWLSEL